MKKISRVLAAILSAALIVTMVPTSLIAQEITVSAEDAAAYEEKDLFAADETNEAAPADPETEPSAETEPSDEETDPETDPAAEDDPEAKEGETENGEAAPEEPMETVEDAENENDTGSIWDDNETVDLSETVGDIPPAKVADAIKTCSDALAKLGADTKDLSAFQKTMGRITNLSSLAGGGIAILQLMGILEDPTMRALINITSLIEQQNVYLQEMNDKLNSLAADLKLLQAEGLVNQRATTAMLYTQNWLSYRRNYLENMKGWMNTYKGWVLAEVKAWTDTTKHENLYVYYTMLDGVKTQTYSKKKNMDLAVSDNGEKIQKEYTIGLPGKYIDAVLADYKAQGRWNVDTFKKDITPLLAQAVTNAMGANELGCSESFKQRWTAASDKMAIATEVATDLLNSEIFLSACRGVNNNPGSANQLISLMEDTWVNTLDPNTGLASQVVPLQMTYCFEGEVKTEIEHAYNSMIAITNLYSTFVMTVGSQSDTVPKTDKTKTEEQWVNGMEYFKKSKSTALKGKDNYCYITNSLVEYKEYTASGSSNIQTMEYQPLFVKRVVLKKYGSQPWKLLDSKGIAQGTLSIVNDATAIALHKTWGKNRTGGTKTFVEYLNKFGTNTPATFSEQLMTTYHGARIFSLNEGILMRCQDPPFQRGRPKYFREGNDYKIMTNASRHKHTVLHDKVTVNYFNPADGSLQTNAILAARAQYCESRKSWLRDEPWYFAYLPSTTKRMESYSSNEASNYQFTINYNYTTEKKAYALVCTALPKRTETFAENEFDPMALLEEMAVVGVVDTAYKAHTDEKIISRSDWNTIADDFVITPDTEEEITECAEEYIGLAVKDAAENGMMVNLTESETEALIDQIYGMIKAAAKEMNANGSINNTAFLDPFGLYGNDEAMKQLALRVLPESEIASDGQTMETVKNMITAAIYEPFFKLNCVKNGDTYKLVPELIYEVTPVLLVWCEDAGTYTTYNIGSEVMQSLGLTMKVRLNASNAGSNDIAEIIHYDDVDTMNVLEKKTVNVQGSGNSRYAEITVSKCSPFSISFSSSQGSTKVTSAKTGDGNQMMLWCLLLAAASAALIGGAVITRRRREKSK